MRIAAIVALGLLAGTAQAQVVRVADLNTRQIQALDRARTVVILQGGMLEEHGPYLPAFTDGILSARLADEVARGIAAEKPGWTVLVFPPISIGASGYNEIGRHFTFPGTYAIRPSTLRAMFMDIAGELGDQGFQWVLVVHVHGSPLHIGGLDEAGDFFRAQYGGTMVNLWGLLPVISGWGRAMAELPDSIKQQDGFSLHAGLDEHSMMLYLQPSLVAPDYREAPTVAANSYDSAFALARRPEWTGYVGAPRLATAEIGRRIWTGFSTAALRTAVQILDGAELSRIQRYQAFMERNPLYRDWIAAARARDSVIGERQRAWRAAR